MQRTMKKTLSFVLALALVFSMSIGLFSTQAQAADGEYTISITQDNGEGYVYQAYQVFSGNLTETHDDQGNVTGTTLSDIKWGTGVDGVALLTALKTANATYGWTEEYAALFITCSDAADVAEVLSNNYDNTGLAEAFAKMAAANKTEVVAGTSGEYVLLDDGSYGYKITVSGAGYYLITNPTVPQDDEGNDYEAAHSDYILIVLEDELVVAKDDIPDVEKKIIDNDQTDTNVNSTEPEGAYSLGTNETIGPVADYSIGDTITFQLTGTLPSNYDSYDTYRMEFHDTESEGLTFAGANTMKVYVLNSDGQIVQVGSGYEVKAGTGTSDGCTFEVIIEDTKSLKDTTGNLISTNSDSEIYVVYQSTLNSDATIGNDGNPNEVYMVFSNDSNSTGTGRTEKKIVAAFTFTLDILKTDDTQAANPLEDAEFILYRGTEGSYEYAILDEGNKVSEWTTDKDQATVIMTDEDGNVSVIGLDEGVYYLEETKAPEGYNLLSSAITITVEAVYDDEASAQAGYPVVKSLTVTVSGNDLASTADEGVGNPSTGVVGIEVQNHSGSRLPSTGGIGTYIFYIIGGAIVVCAAVVLVTRRRMRRAA